MGGDGGGIVIPPARRLPGAPMPQRTRTGFHASGPCPQANAMVVVIRRHADRVSKLATARRPMKPLAFRSNAPAGHWWEPTKNSNPTKHMHLGRRRCFYLAVLKSGNRASGRPPRAQSDKRSVRAKQGSNDGLTQNLYPASKPREGTGRGPHAGISGANGTKIIAAVSHLGTRPRWRQGSSRDRSTPGR